MTVLPFRSLGDVDAALPDVAEHLAQGGILAYPTETVYGLGSRIEKDDLEKLRGVTERQVGKPFLMLVAGEQMARGCGLVFTRAADRLAERFWPGPLTLVLEPGDSTLPDALRGPDGGIAVRWSSHTRVSRLIEGLGAPISSTSANIAGQDPLTNVADIATEFERRAGEGRLLMLDGGILDSSLSSTLVDCTCSELRILREGPISRGQIRECVEEVRR